MNYIDSTARGVVWTVETAKSIVSSAPRGLANSTLLVCNLAKSALETMNEIREGNISTLVYFPTGISNFSNAAETLFAKQNKSTHTCNATKELMIGTAKAASLYYYATDNALRGEVNRTLKTAIIGDSLDSISLFDGATSVFKGVGSVIYNTPTAVIDAAHQAPAIIMNMKSRIDSMHSEETRYNIGRYTMITTGVIGAIGFSYLAAKALVTANDNPKQGWGASFKRASLYTLSATSAISAVAIGTFTAQTYMQ